MRSNDGFTLVELIIVLLLVGVLSGYAVVRTSDANSLRVQAYADRFKQHIKQTQMLAMSWGQSLTMTISSNGYQVSCSNGIGNAPCDSSPVINPATGQTFSVGLADNVSIQSSGSLSFDALGRPLQSSTIASSSSQWVIGDADFQITLNVNPISGSVN